MRTLGIALTNADRLKGSIMRKILSKLIQNISPFDDVEKGHIADALAWMASGAEVYKIKGPAIPPKHLTAYGVLIDKGAKKILLVDHIKAELWLPAGGHVDRDEHPRATVAREIQEELGIVVEFLSDDPVFLTETVTVGKTAGHTDVCFWYALRGDETQAIVYDTKEFNGYRWFGFDEILQEEKPIFDVQMKRFLRKWRGIIKS